MEPGDIIYKKCGRCDGLGYVPGIGGIPVENPCITCLGEKYLPSGQTIDLSVADDDAEAAIAAIAVTIAGLIDTVNDLVSTADDILDKCNDIYEAVTE